jgi:hypothetical protein
MTIKCKIFILTILFFSFSFARDPFAWIGSEIGLPNVETNSNIFNISSESEDKDFLHCIFVYLENDDESDKMVKIYNRAYNLFKSSGKIKFYRFPALCCGVSPLMVASVVPTIVIVAHDSDGNTSKILVSEDDGFTGVLEGINTYEAVIRFIQNAITIFAKSKIQ